MATAKSTTPDPDPTDPAAAPDAPAEAVPNDPTAEPVVVAGEPVAPHIPANFEDLEAMKVPGEDDADDSSGDDSEPAPATE
jgi:hypothetical protein